MAKYFDGHNDCLSKIYPPDCQDSTAFLRTQPGHLDLPRAKACGMIGGLFAIFVDEPHQPEDESLFLSARNDHPLMDPPLDHYYAQEKTNEVLSHIFAAQRLAPEEFSLVSTRTGLKRAVEDQRLAVILHLEGCEALDRKLHMLDIYYHAGIRSFGITWSRPNLFGQGVPFCHPSSPNVGTGLTILGRQLVKKCSDLGVVLDMAHLNERGFWDVAALYQAPLVVSHTACHALCKSARNLTDEQIQAVAETNGVVGITFHVADIRPDGKMDSDTSLDILARHFYHVAELVGTSHVCLGSDFDGALIPDEIAGVTGLAKVSLALKKVGFNDQDLENVLWRNWLRVIDDTWKE